MIKKSLHKSFSVVMALLVLFSTLSFTVEKHYCGSNLVDVSVFSEAKKCAMEKAEKETAKITKKSCCKDIVDVIEGQNELHKITFDDLDLDTQQFAAVWVISYANLFESLPQQIIPHKDYSPPNLVVDIGIRDQVFLI